MTKADLLKLSRFYGVKGISFGGCVELKVKGFRGAMRRRAHAHCYKDDKWNGWICFLSKTPENRAIRNGKTTRLFWHEVAHIYRPSWTQKQCDKWAFTKAIKMNRAIE